MDVLTVFLLLLVVILILNNKSSVNHSIQDLEFKILELKRVIEQLRLSNIRSEAPKREEAEATKPAVIETPQVKLPGEPVAAPQPLEKEPEPEFIHPENIERQ